MSVCNLCNRNCNVDRDIKKGVCGESNTIRVSYCGLHKGEEPPITGENGSGMIFFTGCSLHCKYCQNYQISQKDGFGINISIEELSQIMLSMQNDQKAHTINLVTASHFTLQVVQAIILAKEKGLSIPIVYNTSGYEKVETLKLIDPYIDLYLIDLKTLDENVAKIYCGSKDYPVVVKKALDFIFSSNRKTYEKDSYLYGTLVRHLMFPNTLKETKDVIKWFSKYKDKAYLSVMVQFIPPLQNFDFEKVSEKEYNQIVELLTDLDIDNGFIQEEGDEVLWIPDFRQTEPFPHPFSKVNKLFLELKNKRVKK